jgi:FAD/FMN-containing dehydrogenase
VNLARRRGKVLKVVGSAHSPSDIHLSSEWMMSLDNLNSVISHDLDNRTITIQAGMRLFQYLKELEKRGWSIDNLGSISEQSMAGVISTCTHGSSLSHGVISTQVLTPICGVDGRWRILRWCWQMEVLRLVQCRKIRNYFVRR